MPAGPPYVTIEHGSRARRANYAEVIAQYAAGEKVAVIALLAGVNPQTVCMIIDRHAPHLKRRPNHKIKRGAHAKTKTPGL